MLWVREKGVGQDERVKYENARGVYELGMDLDHVFLLPRFPKF